MKLTKNILIAVLLIGFPAGTATLRAADTTNKTDQTEQKDAKAEPYPLEKCIVSGDSTERIDTRVLQVIFSFERGELPIFGGQQMDVFIDAPEPAQNGGEHSPVKP